MMFLAQALTLSVGSIVPIIISILLGTLTAWLSVQIVSSRASFQAALLFSAVSYVVLMFSSYIPAISIPFVSVFMLIQAVIKSVLAMKIFNTNFKSGLAIAAVQMLLGMIITFSF
jgi:hypothetical protein